MENQTRCTVIKGMDPLSRHEPLANNIQHKTNGTGQYLLPKQPHHHHHHRHQIHSAPAVNMSMGFGSDKLLLPPILTFAHLAFPPSTEFTGNVKASDYFQTYPPLFSFDHLKQQQQVYHHHRPTAVWAPTQPQRSASLISATTALTSKPKKPKFDFSIEALTSKEDNARSNQEPPRIIKEEEAELEIEEQKPLFSPNDFNFGDERMKSAEAVATSISIKSRGRPSADSIELLKQKSIQNPHRYSCSTCGRSFPRKKSLDTHKLTHSDIKPYACDFPGCQRKFKQSGQLKTHLRLHTGEKPFKCTFLMCESAFTHANRKCSKHPGYPLQRTSSTDTIPPKLYEQICDKNNDVTNIEKVKDWFQRQFQERGSKISQCKENKVPADNGNMGHSLPKKILNQCNSNDENCKRLLSAVALVELRDQNKNGNNRKENYEKLFSINNLL